MGTTNSTSSGYQIDIPDDSSPSPSYTDPSLVLSSTPQETVEVPPP